VAVHGVLLAGGRARRFGSDKRLAMLDGRSLLARSLVPLRAVFGARVLVALGADATLDARRPQLAGVARHIRVRDTVAGGGPLAGIAAALRATGDGVVAIAADTPWIDAPLLDHLARLGSRCDRVVAVRGTRDWEPLVAYWPQGALTTIEAALRDGRRAPYRLLDRLSALAVRGVPRSRLHNINRPADLVAVCGGGTGASAGRQPRPAAGAGPLIRQHQR
jgi:molybdopterin-guanine dinucleotide biosynthesis protein A